MVHRMVHPVVIWGAVFSGVVFLAACGGEQAPGAAMPGGGVGTVGVVEVHAEAVARVAELPGRTVPFMVAEVRPQVSGIVRSRDFREGGVVESGQVLYRIDPLPYQAAYQSAKASLERAEAGLESARLKAARQAELVRVQAVSKESNDDAQAALKQARADVESARAALARAKIDLDYTRLNAPIGGRIGRSAVTSGALVTANQADALAVIQQLDPIYVDLNQSSADLLRLRRAVRDGRVQAADEGELSVRLVLEDGSDYPLEGRLAFSEVTVGQDTGSVTLRAVFPNPKGELLPGMYVRARLIQGIDEQAFLVPHAALMRDARGAAQVWLVNAEGKVEPRMVKADRSKDGQWVVTDGLVVGDRVIVDGLQKVRPGAPVRVGMLVDGASAPRAH
ncbi:MAG: efflux RND transporter periplasmic adaptor subunit [Pseudomonadota bacterium]